MDAAGLEALVVEVVEGAYCDDKGGDNRCGDSRYDDNGRSYARSEMNEHEVEMADGVHPEGEGEAVDGAAVGQKQITPVISTGK